MRLLAVALLALLLVPAASAGPSAPFRLGPGGSQAFQLALDRPAEVRVAVRFEPGGFARDLTLDGPGSCDLAITASGAGSATMGAVRCRLPAGTHAFTLALGAGAVVGRLVASKGSWA